MEHTLDEISHGKVSWLPYLEGFYKGDNGLEAQVQKREGDIDPGVSRTVALEGLPCVVRIGRFGAYLETVGSGKTGRRNCSRPPCPRRSPPPTSMPRRPS